MMPSTGERLKRGQRRVPRPRGQVHDEVVEVAPDNVGPELLDRRGHERASPDDGVVRPVEQEIQGHHPDTGRALRWEEAKPDVLRLPPDPEELRDARPGDVGVQDAHAVARPGQGRSMAAGPFPAVRFDRGS